jgi:DNA (cytosine-5)-methyltransferase 1
MGASLRDRAGGPTGLSPQAVSTKGAHPLRVIDMFAGIGGFSLGLHRTGGFETVAFAEVDPYASRVLAKRFPGVPNIGDVTTAEFPDADFICAGFPCQDISNAGKRAGIAGERSGLWREVVRAIRVVRPSFVLLENVAALLVRGLDKVLGDLAAVGHDAEWDCIPASAVGAPHRRDRTWIVAHPERDEQPRLQSRYGPIGRMGWEFKPLPWDRDWQSALRELRGMDDGLSYRVDRVDTLRNAVVPQVVELIGRAILAAQGIAARSGETTQIGSTEGKSPVGNADAPKTDRA